MIKMDAVVRFALGVVMVFFSLDITEATAQKTDSATASSDKPNIVLILCDNLGYGDVQCLNPTRGKIKTPSVDKLALSGKPIESSRAGMIHNSIDGHFAYRQGKWKLCLAKGSGG